MLIRITNQCNMMCSHCMIDGVSPTGEHMTKETFIKALDFAKRSGAMIIALTGGEPTLHPDLFDFIKESRKGAFSAVVIASNGTFLHHKEMTKVLRDLVRRYKNQFHVQITNDPRYYPRSIPKAPKEFAVENHITLLRGCKRVKENGMVPTTKGPSCFNLRSASRVYGYRVALPYLEVQMARFCVPSINFDGSVRAGEPDTCHKIGTVHSSMEEIDRGLRTMQCNKCGLEDGLDYDHLQAIGSKRLVTLR